VQEVIDEAVSTIKVFNPDGRKMKEVALYDTQANDPHDPNSIYIMDFVDYPISPTEWLPVLCQEICWENLRNDAYSHYHRNIDAILPSPEMKANAASSLGPSAFEGRIALNRSNVVGMSMDAIRLDIAHELVHVFRAMIFVVPAFIAWKTFRDVTPEQTSSLASF
jgi:hypothetical protein